MDKKNRRLAAPKPEEIARLKKQIASLRESQKELNVQLAEVSRDNSLFQTLFDTIPDLIYFKDANSKFIKVNTAWVKHKRLSRADEAVGKTDFDYFEKSFAQGTQREEKRIMRTRKSLVGKLEHLMPGSKASEWHLATKVPVVTKQGEVVGTCGITRDITPLKSAEEALQKAHDELELRVQERTADLRKANKLLETQLSQLNFLNDVSYQLAQFISLDELGPAIIEAFLNRFARGRAEGALCVRNENGFDFLCATPALASEQGQAAARQSLEVFVNSELQRPFVVNHWRGDDHVGSFSWPDLGDNSWYMAFPLVADNRVVGIIQIFSSKEAPMIYERELSVLTTLGAHAAACLSNALHYRELGSQSRMQGELDAARSIQQRFTPRDMPSIPRVRLKGAYYPAYEVGGDYLDYFQAENGNWVVVVADVCGKGVPAALFMTMLRSAFRLHGGKAVSAKGLVCAVNDSMRINLDDRSFVTALCLVINKEGTSMSYARAGHPVLLRLRRQGGRPEQYESNGLALGLVSDGDLFASMMDEIIIPLEQGDRFLIYTDGLTEATNPDQKPYGNLRLFDLLAADRNSDADMLMRRIMDDVSSFTKDSEPSDDLTVLALQVTG